MSNHTPRDACPSCLGDQVTSATSSSSSPATTARRPWLLLAVPLVVAALVAARVDAPPASSAKEMIAAAQSLKEMLTPDQIAAMSFAYDDAERVNWHFIPRPRRGLVLGELTGRARQAALRFVQSGLSESGYDQSLKVMSLEEVLFLLEGGDRDYRRNRRDPNKYFLSVFGEPKATGTWGWRVEGHHLSLNYVVKDGVVVASTPEFYGANPGTIDAGKGRALRVLGNEEDLARQILLLCSPAQQTELWISREAPDDIADPGTVQPTVPAQVGLKLADMSPPQQALLQDLLTEYLQNMPADVQQSRRALINAAAADQITFAWWGEKELGQRHHYRVQGPTFLIEYNNTQNEANHVHSVWRNLQGDFYLERTAPQ